MNDSSFPEALPAQYQLHWYVLERVLGQGGFGITYQARDSNLDKLVAIKEYLPTDTATRRADATVSPRAQTQSERYNAGLESFIREARTLARFNHPNIVRVHSVFQHNNTAYMVMEFEEGETLAALLERRQTLSERELLNVVLPVLDGLALVHAAGFIHRDIKPENILVRKDGSPVLLDFGSARAAMGPSRTLTILVAPGYAPYEQYYASADSQGPWTDIYSLGATCYRAITGEPPMDAITRSKGVLGSTREMLAPAIERGARRYSPQFLQAVDHALAFAERDRPQTLDQWRGELTGGGDTAGAVAGRASAAAAGAPVARQGPSSRELFAWAGLGAALTGLAFLLWPRSPTPEAERLAQIERQLSAVSEKGGPGAAGSAGGGLVLPASVEAAPPAAVPSALLAAPQPPAALPAAREPAPAEPLKPVAPKAVPRTPPKPVVATAAAPAALTRPAPAPVAAPMPAPAVAAAPQAAPPAAPAAPAPAAREEARVAAAPRAPEPPVPSDEKEAFAFYRARALKGDADARFRLGEMYAQGRGVTQNLNQAYLWYGLAGLSGHGGARVRQAQVAERLQPAERRQADRQIEQLGKDFGKRAE
ncbi:serine/threonine-protein kinase [Ramlibacter sp. 2FC]|uniref:serine/threonine-protein kinase n=1 Tax=Ramlibacter sp. 2FC TaxID=2502188 RepID=UPI0014853196|nr:serine/threonine-protein kinase [Ramlibacter sp. 2FC]